MKKRVLFVINSMGRAGAEKVLTAFLQTLDTELLEIDFLSVINRGEMFAELPPQVNVLNQNPSAESLLIPSGKRFLIKTVLKSLFRRALFVRLLPYLVRNLFAQLKRGRVLPDKLLWRVLSDSLPAPQQEYDLAVGFTEGAATYYVADKVRARQKIAFVHVDYAQAGYLKSLDKRYYNKMDTIFSVSQSVLDNFTALYPELKDRTRVFQNILLPENIMKAAEEGDGFTDGFNGIRLLTVARLHPQKALDLAVSAFAKLVLMGYDRVRWYILGEGPERSLLEKLVAEHGLQDAFILAGAVSNPYPYIKQCDIYVQASHYEGWCIALAEALALGRPAIASDCTGNREQIIPEENGLLIQLSEENLTGALKRLIDDSALRERFSKTLAARRVDYAKDAKLIYEILGLPAHGSGCREN